MYLKNVVEYGQEDLKKDKNQKNMIINFSNPNMLTIEIFILKSQFIILDKLIHLLVYNLQNRQTKLNSN